jgi:hypothetical protein
MFIRNKKKNSSNKIIIEIIKKLVKIHSVSGDIKITSINAHMFLSKNHWIEPLKRITTENKSEVIFWIIIKWKKK